MENALRISASLVQWFERQGKNEPRGSEIPAWIIIYLVAKNPAPSETHQIH